MIWKVKTHTHTCKYFLAILKKFYEILETLVKLQSNRHKRPRTNPCSHTTALCIHFGYCLRDSGCSFLSPPNCASFHSYTVLTHTHIHTHTASTDDREGKRGKSHYTNTHSYANSHPFTFTLTYTHTCTQI